MVAQRREAERRSAATRRLHPYPALGFRTHRHALPLRRTRQPRVGTRHPMPAYTGECQQRPGTTESATDAVDLCAFAAHQPRFADHEGLRPSDEHVCQPDRCCGRRRRYRETCPAGYFDCQPRDGNTGRSGPERSEPRHEHLCVSVCTGSGVDGRFLPQRFCAPDGAGGHRDR